VPATTTEPEGTDDPSPDGILLPEDATPDATPAEGTEHPGETDEHAER